MGRIGLCRPSRPSTIIARLRQCAQGWMSHPACGYPFVGGVPTRIAHELTGPTTEAACERIGLLHVLPTDDFSNEFTRPSRARRITALIVPMAAIARFRIAACSASSWERPSRRASHSPVTRSSSADNEIPWRRAPSVSSAFRSDDSRQRQTTVFMHFSLVEIGQGSRFTSPQSQTLLGRRSSAGMLPGMNRDLSSC